MKKLNKFVKLTLALIISAFISFTPLMAQELAPEHLALARKYVDLTDQSKIYEVSLLQSGVNTMNTLMAKNSEIADELNEAIGKTIAEYADKKGDLLDKFARVYASTFTIEEMQEIVDFYETETGKKLASNNAIINKDLQTVMGIFESNLRIEFFAKVRSKLRDKGIDI